jgi:hypothetical protein
MAGRPKAKTAEEIAERKRAERQRWQERHRERMENDPEYAEAFRARCRANVRRNRERCKADPEAFERYRERNQRYRDAHRHDDAYRLRQIYYKRLALCQRDGLPYVPQSEWVASLPPRPEDTEVCGWALRAIEPSKGLVPGNYEWVKRCKRMVFDGLKNELNIGCEGTDKSKRRRLGDIAKRNNIDTVEELAKCPEALSRLRVKNIDHAANIGRFFGYSLRVIDLDVRRNMKTTSVFYICRCSVCKHTFSCQAARLLGSKGRPGNTDCPFCSDRARRSKRRSRNSGYYELKRKLHNIVAREDIAHESLSHYTWRSRNMDFTDFIIDAKLAGRLDEMQQIYDI